MNLGKKSKTRGLTLIELIIVATILALLTLLAIFAVRQQLIRGRDSRRKADLAKIQKILEDYYNDKNSYPDRTLYVCGPTSGSIFEGYINEIPCDPINNLWYNYFYSTSDERPAKAWYKIYAKLENIRDPIIAAVGCSQGCGPSNNYNYWVSSANMNKVAQQPGESWWPVIPVQPPPGASPQPTPPGGTITPPPGGTSTPTPPGGGSPTPPSSPTPTLTCAEMGEGWTDPICGGPGSRWCQPGLCGPCCPAPPQRCCTDDGKCCRPL